MELVQNFIGEMFFGFLVRVFLLMLVAAITGKKLGNPHPFWGLLTLYYYTTTESSSMNPAFVVGFVALDFKAAIHYVVIDCLLGGAAETVNAKLTKKKTTPKPVKVHRIDATKVQWVKK